jgi:hypothetical protein
MERSSPMGRVLTEALVENLQDLWDVQRGWLPPQDARRVTVTDARVDTGATTLALPRRFSSSDWRGVIPSAQPPHADLATRMSTTRRG